MVGVFLRSLTVTQVRMLISESVIPSLVVIALLVRTCPINATKTVTKDISIVLARIAVTKFAVDNVMAPCDDTVVPQRGSAMAAPSQIALITVEYTDMTSSQIANPLVRPILTFAGGFDGRLGNCCCEAAAAASDLLYVS